MTRSILPRPHGRICAVAALAGGFAAITTAAGAGHPAARALAVHRPAQLALAPAPPPDVLDPPTHPPTPAPTPPPPVRVVGPQPPPVRAPVSVGRVYAIGDSIMIDIQPALSADVATVTVDGAVSRSWGAGVSILSTLRSSGRLPPIVVVELGTNGPVSGAQFDAMMQACAGAQRVVITTVRVPRYWESEVNTTLRAGVTRYPNTVLADWYTYSAGHPEWFGPDGYHLPPAGAAQLAALIASVV